MKFFYYCIIIFIFYSRGFAFIANNSVDSLLSSLKNYSTEKQLEIVTKKIDNNRRIAPNYVIKLEKFSLKLADKLNSTKKKAELLAYLGCAYSEIGEHDNALDRLIIAERLADSLNLPRISAISKQFMGYVFSYHAKFENSLRCLNASYNIWIKMQNKREMASILTVMATIYSIFGNYSKSIDLYYRALNYYDDINFDEGIAWSEFSIGVLCAKNKAYSKAKSYVERALVTYKKLEKQGGIRGETGVALCYSQLSTISLKEKQFDIALEYAKTALEYRKKAGTKTLIAAEYVKIGTVYYERGEAKTAKYYFAKGLEQSRKAEHIYGMCTALMSLSNIEIIGREYEKAKRHLDTAIIYVKKMNSLNLEKDIYRIFSKYYKATKQYNKALNMYEKYAEIKDTVYNKTNINKIFSKEIEFKTSNVKKENRKLKEENDIKDLKLLQAKEIRNYIIIFILLVVLLLITIYSKYRTISKVNKKVYEQREILKEQSQELLNKNIELANLMVEKNKFFSMIFHDLRSPFTALLGYSQMLSENYSNFTEEELSEIIKLMYQSVSNTNSLIEELFFWFNSEKGIVKTNPEFFELEKTINSVINLLNPQAEEKKIKIEQYIDDNRHEVFLDKNMISAVLRNLIANAIKFTNQGGVIKVRTSDEDKSIKVSVEDNGIGMTSDDLKKIFDPSSIISRLGTKNEKGSGLGLIFCKEFIEKNGGKIYVESKPNQGSKFYFTLKKIY